MAKKQKSQSKNQQASQQNTTAEKCRIDKWLWAARFFKTRSLANAAIETGKVHVDEQRVKASKEVQIGQVMRVRKGAIEIEATVTGLSNIRRGAPEAALLYQETEESVQKRESIASSQSADFASRDRGAGRPTKRQQREIRKFTGR